MKILIDEEAKAVISYMSDVALKSDGVNAYNNIRPLLDAIEILPEVSKKPDMEVVPKKEEKKKKD